MCNLTASMSHYNTCTYIVLISVGGQAPQKYGVCRCVSHPFLSSFLISLVVPVSIPTVPSLPVPAVTAAVLVPEVWTA